MEDSKNLYHHVGFYVSNALQSAYWYVCNFGFERFAARRCQTYSQIAIKNGKVILLFTAPLLPTKNLVNEEVSIHGDFVKDVAFLVDDLDSIIQIVESQNFQILQASTVEKDDFGLLKIAKIKGSADDISHTLIQNLTYNGLFLPGFRACENFKIAKFFTPIAYIGLDHVVEGHPSGTVETVAEWYDSVFDMKRFWSIDDKMINTQYSSLRAILVGDRRQRVKVVLAEPVCIPNSKRKGQVQEFLDHHGNSGVQHIAFCVNDIVRVVRELSDRGVDFLDIPDYYYDILENRIRQTIFENVDEELQAKLLEQLKAIRDLKILMDFDTSGYLLQIFTKPQQDRPTFFIEIIQRHNFDGFGAGNFQALFQAVEFEQQRRDLEMFTSDK